MSLVEEAVFFRHKKRYISYTNTNECRYGHSGRYKTGNYLLLLEVSLSTSSSILAYVAKNFTTLMPMLC